MATNNNNDYSPRIDELPFGIPAVGDFIPFFDRRNGITKRLDATIFNPTAFPVPGQNFEWIYNRMQVDGVTPFHYNLNDVVTRGGNWYQSLIANNTSAPGSSDTWLLLTKGYSSDFWKPAIYTDEKVWVFSNHSGTYSIYILVDPARPFISTNIETETNAGKWIAISGGGSGSSEQIEVVNTKPETIIFDLKNATQKLFRGSDNIDGQRIWNLINDERAVEWKFFFTMAGLFPQIMPDNIKMSTPLFDKVTKTWQPMDIGEYEAAASYDGLGALKIDIYGPYGGGGNQAPQLFNNVISLGVGNVASGSYTYYDAEGDLENNRRPEVRSLSLSYANNNPGTVATATWTFYSHSGYAQGTHRYQWYRSLIDGTQIEIILGATSISREFTTDDIDKNVYIGVIAVQVATAPANGNPESLEVLSSGVVVEEFVPATLPRLDLALYTHAAKAGTYDAALFRIKDAGASGGVNYFTSPDAASRPAYDSVTKWITFDPTVSVRYFEFPVISSNFSKTLEIVGTFMVDGLDGVNETLVSCITNVWAKVFKNDDTIRARSGSISATNGLVLLPNTPYAYRIRMILGSFIEIRIQINYDEAANSFLLDYTYVGTSQGAAVPASTIGRWGVAHDTTPPTTEPFKGKQKSLAIMVGAHLAGTGDNEKMLWRTLRDDAGY